MDNSNDILHCCHRRTGLCQNPTCSTQKRKRSSMENFIEYQKFAKKFNIDGTHICNACHGFWKRRTNDPMELTDEQLTKISGL
jgi:hypothetical protein